jgi:hypothetical protein
MACLPLPSWVLCIWGAALTAVPGTKSEAERKQAADQHAMQEMQLNSGLVTVPPILCCGSQ